MINDLMIRSFLTLSETLNFTTAAKVLYLSQQAVSKHIAKLEEDLHCQLFTRERGNIHLTPAGEVYLEVFSQYNENLRQAALRVNGADVVDHKKIRIGYLDLLDLNTILGPSIKEFRDAYPDAIIEYHSALDWELPLLFKDNRIDIALTFDKLSPDFAQSRFVRLFQAREMLFVSKNHPYATPDASYMDFKDEPVYFSLPPNGNLGELLHRMDELHFPYDNLVLTENMLSACTAIDMVQGISFAVEHSHILELGVYATYPTNNIVNFILCADPNNPKKYLQYFLEEVQKKYEQ